MRSTFLSLLLAGSALTIPSASQAADELTFELLSTYETGIFDEGAAEIVAHHAGTQRLYVVNADAGEVDILDIQDPASPEKIGALATEAHGWKTTGRNGAPSRPNN